MNATIPNPCRAKFVCFRELTPALANVELQVHTRWTDGSATIREALEAARARGLDAIAFTEHVRRDTDWFPCFAAAVREESIDFPELDVFVGCEAKALDGHGALDASDEALALSDIVLGSVHRFPDGSGGLLDFKALDAATIARTECELALGLLRAAPIHVLAHPGGMALRQRGHFPDELFRRLLEASRERGIAVEINSSYLSDLDGFIGLCREIDPLVSIGSDAHSVAEIGCCRDALLSRFARPVQPL